MKGVVRSRRERMIDAMMKPRHYRYVYGKDGKLVKVPVKEPILTFDKSASLSNTLDKLDKLFV